MKNEIEIIWDFGLDDSMLILVMRRNKENHLQIYRRFQDKNKPLIYYLNMITNINKEWRSAKHHLPLEGYLKNINGLTIVSTFRSYGFNVDHVIE